ncbi:hypothetical protein HY640_01580 [Candidatus Woesearchaeota archaeon]|nr:hypothetical protein [Candidatus Woesearchaeota archaeon]
MFRVSKPRLTRLAIFVLLGLITVTFGGCSFNEYYFGFPAEYLSMDGLVRKCLVSSNTTASICKINDSFYDVRNIAESVKDKCEFYKNVTLTGCDESVLVAQPRILGFSLYFLVYDVLFMALAYFGLEFAGLFLGRFHWFNEKKVFV